MAKRMPRCQARLPVTTDNADGRYCGFCAGFCFGGALCVRFFVLAAGFFLVAPVATRLEWRGRWRTLVFGAASLTALTANTASSERTSVAKILRMRTILLRGTW